MSVVVIDMAGTNLLYSARSPYGLLSVVETGQRRILYIDGRPLCGGAPGALDSSEWDVGTWPVERLDTDLSKGIAANIGLGCVSGFGLRRNWPLRQRHQQKRGYAGCAALVKETGRCPKNAIIANDVYLLTNNV